MSLEYGIPCIKIIIILVVRLITLIYTSAQYHVVVKALIGGEIGLVDTNSQMPFPHDTCIIPHSLQTLSYCRLIVWKTCGRKRLSTLFKCATVYILCSPPMLFERKTFG